MKNHNNLIVEALTPFDIPLYYADVPEDILDNMNYIYYRESSLQRDKGFHFIQIYEVAYVSQYQDDLMEEEMIDAIEKKGFKFRSGVYDRLKLTETTDFIDIFVMTFAKPIKRKKMLDC